MKKTFKVRVNKEMEFKISEDEISTLDTQRIAPSQYHVLQQHKSFNASIITSDFINKKYSVKINSNTYEVAISNELDILIEEMGLTLNSSALINDIKAPMPGLILDVNVAAGDEVKEGDYLLVLEAMKMENTITAPRDGIVKTIKISKGDTVDKNQLLIEME